MRSIFPLKGYEASVIDMTIRMLSVQVNAIYHTSDHAYGSGPLATVCDELLACIGRLEELRDEPVSGNGVSNAVSNSDSPLRSDTPAVQQKGDVPW